MRQIFIAGASIVYGVGGTMGGWPDYLKRHFHEVQYTSDDSESYEVYNMARPGFAVSDLQKTFPVEITNRLYAKSEPRILFSIGGNNAKAVGQPDNFASTPDSFAEEIDRLVGSLLKISTHVLCVGLTPVNEQYSAPKISQHSEECSYFFNSRVKEFSDRALSAAVDAGAVGVDVFTPALSVDWNSMLTYDGLHPNTQGHEWLCAQILPEVEKLI